MKVATMLLMAALGTASAASFGADTISAEDFVKKAGESGLAEVALGKLGVEKSGNAQVRAFSQQMVADHTKANKELTATAQAKNLKVPTEPSMVHKGVMEKYQHQTADTDFNRDFMQRMVKDHEAAVKLFQTAANDSTLDPDLRSFAKKTLPTLEHHLSEAQQLEATLAKKT